jgi:hypothetical protein
MEGVTSGMPLDDFAAVSNDISYSLCKLRNADFFAKTRIDKLGA